MTEKTETPRDPAAGALPVTVHTESRPVLSGLTAAGLRELITELCGPDDHFAVIQHDDRDGSLYYIQTYHEDDGGYQLEYRDGGADRHYSTICDEADQVADLVLGWIAGTGGWQHAVTWKGADFGPPPQELAPDVLDYATETARGAITSGFETYTQVVTRIRESAESGVVNATTAELIAVPLWRARLAEQETWPAVTDADRLDAAGAELEAAGILFRPYFACCGNCGHTELRGLAAPGLRGYVFGHTADFDSAATSGCVGFSYGAFEDAAESTAVDAAVDAAQGENAEAGRAAAAGRIADETVAVLNRHGLTAGVEPGSQVDVTLNWQRRLPQ